MPCRVGNQEAEDSGMKQLEIRLFPITDIGRARISQFVERKNREGLPYNGVAKTFPDGSATIVFALPVYMTGRLADFVKNQAVNQIQAIAKKDIRVESEMK